MGLLNFLQPVYLLAALIAITVHECAHAYVAKRLGDDTAEDQGRLTLNPIAHLDPLGTILFIVVGFGWAKPVPVDPRAFRHPLRDTALVSLAGPVSNLLLAAIAFVLMGIFDPQMQHAGTGTLLAGSGSGAVAAAVFGQLLSHSLVVNLALMAFNLLPIAPLDGSKILQAFIPWRYADAYAEFMRRGPIVLIALILAGDFLRIPILSAWVFGIADLVLRVFDLLTPWW